MSVLLLTSAGSGFGIDSCRTKIKRPFVPTGFNWQDRARSSELAEVAQAAARHFSAAGSSLRDHLNL